VRLQVLWAEVLHIQLLVAPFRRLVVLTELAVAAADLTPQAAVAEPTQQAAVPTQREAMPTVDAVCEDEDQAGMKKETCDTNYS
jgi:hypothetical protein